MGFITMTEELALKASRKEQHFLFVFGGQKDLCKSHSL